ARQRKLSVAPQRKLSAAPRNAARPKTRTGRCCAPKRAPHRPAKPGPRPAHSPRTAGASRPCLELGQPALEEIDHLHRRRSDPVEEGEVEADEIARVNQREEPG